MATRIKIDKFYLIRNGKAIDVVIQSLLMIRYFYVIDFSGQVNISNFRLLAQIQFFSFIIQLFIKFKKKLKIERLISISILFCWLVVYYRYYVHMVRHNESILDQIHDSFSLFDNVFTYAGVIVSFWYIVINYREVKYLMGTKNKKFR